MSETSPIYNIYKNIVNHFKGLEYEIKDVIKDYKEFNVTVQVMLYVDIKAKRGDKKIHIFLLNKGISKVIPTMYSKVEKGTSVYAVGDSFTSMDTAVVESGSRLHVTFLNSKLFMTDIRNHIMVPPHSLCTDKEMEDVMRNNGVTDPSQFPKIRFNDPQVILMEGKPGQLVKIIQKNTITGDSPYYRIIV